MVKDINEFKEINGKNFGEYLDFVSENSRGFANVSVEDVSNILVPLKGNDYEMFAELINENIGKNPKGSNKNWAIACVAGAYMENAGDDNRNKLLKVLYENDLNNEISHITRFLHRQDKKNNKEWQQDAGARFVEWSGQPYQDVEFSDNEIKEISPYIKKELENKNTNLKSDWVISYVNHKDSKRGMSQVEADTIKEKLSRLDGKDIAKIENPQFMTGQMVANLANNNPYKAYELISNEPKLANDFWKLSQNKQGSAKVSDLIKSREALDNAKNGKTVRWDDFTNGVTLHFKNIDFEKDIPNEYLIHTFQKISNDLTPDKSAALAIMAGRLLSVDNYNKDSVFYAMNKVASLPGAENVPELSDFYAKSKDFVAKKKEVNTQKTAKTSELVGKYNEANQDYDIDYKDYNTKTKQLEATKKIDAEYQFLVRDGVPSEQLDVFISQLSQDKSADNITFQKHGALKTMFSKDAKQEEERIQRHIMEFCNVSREVFRKEDIDKQKTASLINNPEALNAYKQETAQAETETFKKRNIVFEIEHEIAKQTGINGGKPEDRLQRMINNQKEDREIRGGEEFDKLYHPIHIKAKAHENLSWKFQGLGNPGEGITRMENDAKKEIENNQPTYRKKLAKLNESKRMIIENDLIERGVIPEGDKNTKHPDIEGRETKTISKETAEKASEINKAIKIAKANLIDK